MKLITVAIVYALLPSCMADAAGNRKVDPAAREFYGRAAVQVIGRVLIDSLSSK